MTKRYIPTALRYSIVEKPPGKKFAVGTAVNERYEIGMKSGPYDKEEDALEYVADVGDFIYATDDKTCVAIWRWEDGGWSECTTVLVETSGVFGDVIEPVSAPVDDSASGGKTLSKDQSVAWEKLKVWVSNRKPYFVMKGFAGTGKTFLMEKMKGISDNVYYSAPTNKATRVIGRSVGVMARTTYSTLGLRMEQVEDTLVLKSGRDVPYFPSNSILVIDEGSIAGTILCDAVDEARQRCDLKILWVGDPAQLPPVGENTSPAWKTTDDPECRAILREVMRFDNQLLTLSVKLRDCIREKDWTSPLTSDHDDTGVWKWKSREVFERALIKRVEAGELVDTKVIAWKNKTVNKYNNLIRCALGYDAPYCVGDLVMLAEPVQRGGTIIAHIDDEFTVTEVFESSVRVDNEQVAIWRLNVQGEYTLVLDVAKDQTQVDVLLGRKAARAQRVASSERRLAWQDFWDTKAKFNKIRYGYALTAHRAQGSTYTNVWVDQMDILSNPNKREGFRCLYVAATRPTTNLYSF